MIAFGRVIARFAAEAAALAGAPDRSDGAVALGDRMIKAGLSSEVLEVRSPVVAAEFGVCRVSVPA
jgi:hypothetical protein